MKKWLGIALLMISSVAYAARAPEKIRNDQFQIGLDGSVLDKIITIDVGDGASNPKITITDADKEFDFSKSIKVLTDSMTLGDGNNTGDQCFTFDIGDGGSNKQLCILDTSKIATLNSDITMGDGTSADKEFVFDVGLGANNPRLKWDQSLLRLQFSNDGSMFKNIGSGGGGGGTNILADNNFDFEAGDPPSDFTATGGTFISESTNPGFGLASGSWNASASGQFLRSTAVAIPEGLRTRSCSARIQYKWNAGTPGDLGWRVEDSSDVLIAGGSGFSGTAKNLDSSSNWREDNIFFTCPSSGDMRIEIESSADAALILTDNWELGRFDFIEVSQSAIVASAYYPATTDCLWQRDNVSVGAMTADSDCPSIIFRDGTGNINTADNDLPDIVITDAKPGIYTVEAFIPIQYSITSSVTMTWSIADSVDGTLNSSRCRYVYNTTTNSDSVRFIACHHSITITTTQDLTFSIHGGENAGGSMQIANNSGELSFKVSKDPLTSAEAITLETVGEFWSVNIGGANPDLTFSAVSTYTEIIDAGLDMVINSGSKSAEIPCSTTNPSTGLTCSAGSEGIGIVINISSAGRYRACLSGGHHAQGNNSGSVQATFQWIETPNNAQTILQEGKYKISSSADADTTSSNGGIAPLSICGDFIFNNAGEKTLRFMYEQTTTTTLTTNDFIADRDAARGQRDIHITVDKLDQQMPTPVFTDLTDSLNSKIESDDGTALKLISLRGVCTASSAITASIGITSLGNIASGACRIELDNIQTTLYDCQVTEPSADPVLSLSIEIVDSDTLDVNCNVVSSGSDCTGSFNFMMDCKYN